MLISIQNYRSMLERSAKVLKHRSVTEKAFYHARTLDFQLGILFGDQVSVEISDSDYQQLMLLASY